MHFFINIGLPFSIHIGRAFVFETDLRSTLFLRAAGVGQAWVQRGATCFEPWARVRDESILPQFTR